MNFLSQLCHLVVDGPLPNSLNSLSCSFLTRKNGDPYGTTNTCLLLFSQRQCLGLSLTHNRHSINISDCFYFLTFMAFMIWLQAAFPDLCSAVSFCHPCLLESYRLFISLIRRSIFQGLPVCLPLFWILSGNPHILESMCRQRKNRVISHSGKYCEEKKTVVYQTLTS